jgi:hypothetical protein
MTRVHAALAALVCVVIPASSWRNGSGSLAWTMFSGSRSYRLELVGIDASGGRRPLAPTALARFVGVEEAPYLAASDTWRMMPYRGIHLRLAEVAKLACRLTPAPDEVQITLFSKRTLDADPETRVERVRCGDPQ